ncbi:hypothetical protein JD79_00584 [Geodermatophilus normandii]|uniref:Uncharacterized protein n=1 Tax=Geodermatophilus normandii TaxID=1137989 RepID=A0A317QDM3_9ACTN|nr:hypothetical protein [Geodermatophilus normandii]PWW21452.1 hypothetical protein JD79_00584 [Geodermatophilus normandii]
MLFLVTRVPGAFDGQAVLRYLEERPVLIEVTLRRIFDVDGTSGASLAQRDAACVEGRRMDDFVIPESIRRGHWTVDFVGDGIALLSRDQAPHLARWFTGLAAQVARVSRER